MWAERGRWSLTDQDPDKIGPAVVVVARVVGHRSVRLLGAVMVGADRRMSSEGARWSPADQVPDTPVRTSRTTVILSGLWAIGRLCSDELLSVLDALDQGAEAVRKLLGSCVGGELDGQPVGVVVSRCPPGS
jgi:hypothetical protein